MDIVGLSGSCPLNAPPFAQLRLLDLQALDSRLDQLAHRRRSLPEHAELEKTVARQTELRNQLVAAETEESEIAREQAKAETDVEQVRARSARDQQRLDSGNVGSARELESLQHEIGSLARRQSDLEDTVLDIMERRETVQGQVAQLQREQAELGTTEAETTGRRDQLLSDLDGEAEQLRSKRGGLVAELPGELVALYEKLRTQFGGVGAAALKQRRCEGCRLELNTTDIARIRSAADDEVLRCEECRRILVRTPESGL